MSTRRRKRKHDKSFVMLGRRTLKCPEWKGLSASAKLLYIHLKAKYNGSNNGEIRLHYSELKGTQGLRSSATVAKAFQELESKGWIKKTKHGGMYRYFNEYELTGRYDECLWPKPKGMAEYKKDSGSKASENPLTLQIPKSQESPQAEKISAQFLHTSESKE